VTVGVAPREVALRRSTAVRRGLAGLLVALFAALSPVLSAVPADAARAIAPAAVVATSPTKATAPGSSTGQESRRGLRAVAFRSGAAIGRRLADGAGVLRGAQPNAGSKTNPPTCPATGSIDATGPPSSYDAATLRPNSHRLGGSHHPAAAGRAPPSFCGS
jgi:hypothetical protein